VKKSLNGLTFYGVPELECLGVVDVWAWGGRCPFQAEFLRKAGNDVQYVYFRSRGNTASIQVIQGCYEEITGWQDVEELFMEDHGEFEEIQPYPAHDTSAGWINDSEAVATIYTLLKAMDERQ
jgi:hypothetical protein